MTAIEVIENYFSTRLEKSSELEVCTSGLEKNLIKYGKENFDKLFNSQTYIRKFRLMRSLSNCKFIIEKIPTKSAEDHYSVRRKI